MAVTRKRTQLPERAYICHFVPYILLFQKIIRNEIPPGDWGSMAGQISRATHTSYTIHDIILTIVELYIKILF